MRSYKLALVLFAAATSCASSLPSLRPLSHLESGDDTADMPPAVSPMPGPDVAFAADAKADWIQLTSGEWLRGELLRIKDDQLDFDSDELDTRSFELDDVRTVRTAGSQVIVTKTDKLLRGQMVIEGETVWVSGTQLVQLERGELLAALGLSADQSQEWSGEISLGVTLRSGNTEQNDYNAYAEAVRETARTRWESTYIGTLSRANDQETANNHRLRSLYDVLLSDRIFVTVPSIELYRDRLQNIEVRATPAALIGYEILDTDKRDWTVGVGPAYQYTRFNETAPGESDTDSSLAVVARSNYSWELAFDTDLDFDYSITAAIPDSDEYNHNFVVRLSVELTDDLTLDVGLVWDRVNRPVADQNGDFPEEDDYRTTIGLGWSF